MVPALAMSPGVVVAALAVVMMSARRGTPTEAGLSVMAPVPATPTMLRVHAGTMMSRLATVAMTPMVSPVAFATLSMRLLVAGACHLPVF